MLYAIPYWNKMAKHERGSRKNNQWEHLCQYFLKVLTTQKTFKQTVKKQLGTKALKTH